jgi:hypothetical protein
VKEPKNQIIKEPGDHHRIEAMLWSFGSLILGI